MFKTTTAMRKAALMLLAMLMTLLMLSERTESVRVCASNLSSGNDQAYHEAGINQLRGLNVTLAAVQEFNYGNNSPAALRSFVDQAFGPSYDFYRSDNTTYQIPNGVVFDRNRFRLMDNGTWHSPVIFNRGFPYTRLHPLLADGSDDKSSPSLFIVSLHLSTQSSKQTVEAQRVVELIQEYYGVNSLTQVTDYLIVAGDFNANSGQSQVVRIFVEAGLLDEPVPVDQLGDSTTNQPRSKRHDFVLQNQLLLATHQPTVFRPASLTTYPDGLVLDTRIFTPISAIFPAQQGDTGVDGMQHLAVVKNYAI